MDDIWVMILSLMIFVLIATGVTTGAILIWKQHRDYKAFEHLIKIMDEAARRAREKEDN